MEEFPAQYITIQIWKSLLDDPEVAELIPEFAARIESSDFRYMPTEIKVHSGKAKLHPFDVLKDAGNKFHIDPENRYKREFSLAEFIKAYYKEYTPDAEYASRSGRIYARNAYKNRELPNCPYDAFAGNYRFEIEEYPANKPYGLLDIRIAWVRHSGMTHDGGMWALSWDTTMCRNFDTRRFIRKPHSGDKEWHDNVLIHGALLPDYINTILLDKYNRETPSDPDNPKSGPYRSRYEIFALILFGLCPNTDKYLTFTIFNIAVVDPLIPAPKIEKVWGNSGQYRIFRLNRITQQMLDCSPTTTHFRKLLQLSNCKMRIYDDFSGYITKRDKTTIQHIRKYIGSAYERFTNLRLVDDTGGKLYPEIPEEIIGPKEEVPDGDVVHTPGAKSLPKDDGSGNVFKSHFSLAELAGVTYFMFVTLPTGAPDKKIIYGRGPTPQLVPDVLSGPAVRGKGLGKKVPDVLSGPAGAQVGANKGEGKGKGKPISGKGSMVPKMTIPAPVGEFPDVHFQYCLSPPTTAVQPFSASSSSRGSGQPIRLKFCDNNLLKIPDLHGVPNFKGRLELAAKLRKEGRTPEEVVAVLTIAAKKAKAITNEPEKEMADVPDVSELKTID
jgi:hypothetical protein